MKKYSEVLKDELLNISEESAAKEEKTGNKCMVISGCLMGIATFMSIFKKPSTTQITCLVGSSLVTALIGLFYYNEFNRKIDMGLSQWQHMDLKEFLDTHFENLWLNSYGMKDATKEEIDQYFKEKRQRNAYNILKRFNDNLNKGE